MNLTTEHQKLIAHAIKVAKFKRLKLTVGNIISLTPPELAQTLRMAYAGQTKNKLPKEWSKLQ